MNCINGILLVSLERPLINDPPCIQIALLRHTHYLYSFISTPSGELRTPSNSMIFYVIMYNPTSHETYSVGGAYAHTAKDV